MPFAVAGAVASIAGGFISAGAAKDAASTQAAAGDRAASAAQAQYQQTRSDLAPFRTGGGAAFNKLLDIFHLNGPNGGGGSVPSTGNVPTIAQSQQGARPQAGQAANLPAGWSITQGEEGGDHGEGTSSPIVTTHYVVSIEK